MAPGRNDIMMSKYMVEKMRKERWNGVGAVVRGSSEDAREVNNQLIFVACLPQGSRVISRPGL